MKNNRVLSRFNFVAFNIIIIVSIFVLTLFSYEKVNSAELVDRIVAVVNDKIITLYELNSALKPYVEQIRSSGYSNEKEEQLFYTIRENMLSQLVDELLTDQEIKNYDITISNNELNDTIERIKKANMYTDEDLRKVLAADGLTMEKYTDSMKKQMLRSKLVEYEVKSKVIITQEDIKSYYEKHTDEYGGKEEYHLLNIILKVPSYADREKKDGIFNILTGVHDKLKEGESFEEMSRMYSESPFAQQGGDIGFFELTQLSDEIRKAIEKIKVGEFTEILDTDQGYQIFFVKEIASTQGTPLEEVSSEIEEKLYSNKVEDSFQAWLKNIRKRAHIKIIK